MITKPLHLFRLALLAMPLLALPAHLQGQAIPLPADHAALSGGALQSGGDIIRIPVGHSVVLTAATPVRRIYVGNPSVLQSYTSGQQEIVLTAKTAGTSSLLVWSTKGDHQLYNIASELDLAPLQNSITEALPGLPITVTSAAGGKVILSGVVPTQAVADSVAHLASLYSKDIVNSLRVQAPHTKQVELKLRIVEVDRSRLEQLGINFFSQGGNSSATSTQQFGSTAITSLTSAGGLLAPTNPLNLLFYSASTNVGVDIQALEQKQILQILAEPTLTTMSGEAARFLSGGEFPVPIVQGGTGNGTSVTVVYRPYGVKVDFTPVVNTDGSIRLKVAPEVSALDYTNSVTLSGFSIPALSTRRSETEVEIQDGQSFAISGLLDHRVTDTMNKVPALGDLPVLGELFRSKSVQRSVLELVVLVTARVVDPLEHAEIAKEPTLAVPNLEPKAFDEAVRKQLRNKPNPPVQLEDPHTEQAGPKPPTQPWTEQQAPSSASPQGSAAVALPAGASVLASSSPVVAPASAAATTAAATAAPTEPQKEGTPQ